MGRYKVISISLICGLLAAAGCGGRRAAGPGAAPLPGCVVSAEPEEQPDTVRIALPDRVDPANAPVPHNDSERILFGHLYETLITIDCEGKLHPGLASQWYNGESGKRWTFHLRRDARFWDGSPVSSWDIVDCWQSAGVEPFIWKAGVDSVAAAGENTIHVYFARPHDELPRELTASPFTVAKIGARWPIGSSPCTVNIEPMVSSPIYRRPFIVSPLSGKDTPVLVFLEPGSSATFDSRDLLEGSVDVMITRDPDVIEYASDRPGFETIPLPWLRTYVLLSTTRVLDIRLKDTPPGLDRTFIEDLARDAVPGLARGHEAPDWWIKSRWCADMHDGSGWYTATDPHVEVSRGIRDRRIVFDEGDPSARSLAERIAALGAAGPGNSPGAARLAEAIPGLAADPAGLSVSGFPAAELDRSLEAGNDFAYIIWLPFHPPDPCTGIMQMTERVNWLAELGDDLDDALLPLVDTRNYAIVRKGTAGLSVDWYGNIFITGTLDRPVKPPQGR